MQVRENFTESTDAKGVCVGVSIEGPGKKAEVYIVHEGKRASTPDGRLSNQTQRSESTERSHIPIPRKRPLEDRTGEAASRAVI